MRARIVLACAEGLQSKQVATTLGVDQATVGKWRHRLETDRPLLLVRPEPLRPTRQVITVVSTINGGHYPPLSPRGRAVRPDAYNENVVAVEVNVIPLDIWNEAQRTLSLTEIADLAAGGHELEGRWRIFSESDAGSIAHVIAFVRKVRLKDGSVLIADMAPVLDAVKALNENISEDDIAPGQDDPNN